MSVLNGTSGLLQACTGASSALDSQIIRPVTQDKDGQQTGPSDPRTCLLTPGSGIYTVNEQQKIIPLTKSFPALISLSMRIVGDSIGFVAHPTEWRARLIGSDSTTQAKAHLQPGPGGAQCVAEAVDAEKCTPARKEYCDAVRNGANSEPTTHTTPPEVRKHVRFADKVRGSQASQVSHRRPQPPPLSMTVYEVIYNPRTDKWDCLRMFPFVAAPDVEPTAVYRIPDLRRFLLSIVRDDYTVSDVSNGSHMSQWLITLPELQQLWTGPPSENTACEVAFRALLQRGFAKKIFLTLWGDSYLTPPSNVEDCEVLALGVLDEVNRGKMPGTLQNDLDRVLAFFIVLAYQHVPPHYQEHLWVITHSGITPPSLSYKSCKTQKKSTKTINDTEGVDVEVLPSRASFQPTAAPLAKPLSEKPHGAVPAQRAAYQLHNPHGGRAAASSDATQELIQDKKGQRSFLNDPSSSSDAADAKRTATHSHRSILPDHLRHNATVPSRLSRDKIDDTNSVAKVTADGPWKPLTAKERLQRNYVYPRPPSPLISHTFHTRYPLDAGRQPPYHWASRNDSYLELASASLELPRAQAGNNGVSEHSAESSSLEPGSSGKVDNDSKPKTRLGSSGRGTNLKEEAELESESRLRADEIKRKQKEQWNSAAERLYSIKADDLPNGPRAMQTELPEAMLGKFPYAQQHHLLDDLQRRANLWIQTPLQERNAAFDRWQMEEDVIEHDRKWKRGLRQEYRAQRDLSKEIKYLKGKLAEALVNVNISTKKPKQVFGLSPKASKFGNAAQQPRDSEVVSLDIDGLEEDNEKVQRMLNAERHDPARPATESAERAFAKVSKTNDSSLAAQDIKPLEESEAHMTIRSVQAQQEKLDAEQKELQAQQKELQKKVEVLARSLSTDFMKIEDDKSSETVNNIQSTKKAKILRNNIGPTSEATKPHVDGFDKCDSMSMVHEFRPTVAPRPHNLRQGSVFTNGGMTAISPPQWKSPMQHLFSPGSIVPTVTGRDTRQQSNAVTGTHTSEHEVQKQLAEDVSDISSGNEAARAAQSQPAPTNASDEDDHEFSRSMTDSDPMPLASPGSRRRSLSTTSNGSQSVSMVAYETSSKNEGDVGHGDDHSQESIRDFEAIPDNNRVDSLGN